MKWVAVLLLLVGCSGPSEVPEAMPAATAPAEMPTPQQPPKPRRYATLEGIYADLGCDSTDVVGAGNNTETLRDMGHCYQFWGSLDVYLTQYGMSGAWAHMTSSEPGVVGPNWIVLAGTEEAAEVVRGLLGGDVRAP